MNYPTLRRNAPLLDGAIAFTTVLKDSGYRELCSAPSPIGTRSIRLLMPPENMSWLIIATKDKERIWRVRCWKAETSDEVFVAKSS